MKRLLPILLILLLLLTACANSEEKQLRTEASDTLPQGLPQIPELSEVAYAEYFSESPDTPEYQFAAHEEIGELLAMLESVHPTAVSETDISEIPGENGCYELHLFDGSTQGYSFGAENTVLIADVWYTYESKVWLSAREAKLTAAADGEKIDVTLYNLLNEDMVITLIPRLELLTADGWKEVEYGEVGFCGTPDPFPADAPTADSVPLSWFREISAGTYRLSYSYLHDAEERSVSGVFLLE